MVKVFLVEDEIIVREGIKNNMKWEENGFTFCGEASDGELAYPMIAQTKPDVVITDIRMPFMDGLELSRILKKELPSIKIIILSGYGEFEYAKEAINIGVTEYLLKPISSVELMKTMRKVKGAIEKEHAEKVNLEKFKNEMKENEIDEKRKLFHDIVNNTQSLSYILEKGKELGIQLSGMYYNIILFKLSAAGGTREETAVKQQEIEEKLDLLLDEKKEVIKFDCLMEGIALLCKGSTMEEVTKTQWECIEQIKSLLNCYDHIVYFGGIGKPVNRLGELSLSLHEANKAFAYRYIWDKCDILDYETITNKPAVNNQSNTIVINDIGFLDKRKAEGFLKGGEREDIPYFVEEYLKTIGKEGRDSLLLRQYIIMDMYFVVVGFLGELGYKADIIDSPLKEKGQAGSFIPESFAETTQYIENIFNQAISLRDEIVTKQYSAIINKAKVYINENYMNEDLSLNTVASSVFISPNHFSAVFSQKTGQTFIKYLTDLRMNKAKELLKCTDMRSVDISYAVGYKDPHYFSYLFKKTQNCTPKQYRHGN